MNKFIANITIGALAILFFVCCVTTKTEHISKKELVYDTIYIDNPINNTLFDSGFVCGFDSANVVSSCEFVKLRDSINIYKAKYDSVNSQLFLSNYKLNKIREYNNIAAKGNNIKFLRGWIKRALGDEL